MTETAASPCGTLFDLHLRESIRRFGEKEPPTEIAEGAIHSSERLGGLLKHYYRQVA